MNLVLDEDEDEDEDDDSPFFGRQAFEQEWG